MRFVLKAIFKPLTPKSSRSSTIITINRVHMNHDFWSDMLNEIRPTRITHCKGRLWMCKLGYSNTQIPDGYLTWYLTSNIGHFLSYFQRMISSRVVRQSLYTIHVLYKNILPFSKIAFKAAVKTVMFFLNGSLCTAYLLLV